MNPLLLLQLGRYILLPIALLLLIYTGYSRIKAIGYQEASVKYELIIQEGVKANQSKLDNLERLSSVIVNNSAKSSAENAKHIGEVITKLKGKSLVVINKGECAPTPAFLSGFSEINRQANESMKEYRK